MQHAERMQAGRSAQLVRSKNSIPVGYSVVSHSTNQRVNCLYSPVRVEFRWTQWQNVLREVREGFIRQSEGTF